MLLEHIPVFVFQVHLLLQVLFQPLFYGTVTPLLAWFAVKKFILDPWEAKKKQKADEEERIEKMSRYLHQFFKNDN